MSGVSDSRRWNVLPSDPQAERTLVEALGDCGMTPLVARVLVARGMSDPDEARRFLTPSLERDWADPFLIPGMEEASDRLERAVTRGEKIAVFGDFDVDGMSATCLLTLALRRLGADVHPYIPDRVSEGYGLSEKALKRVVDDSSPELIVTVDNGIASAREVEKLLVQGIDVIVTDHHEPADLVPEGVPVTNPKLIADGPSRELAGAGVALKLVDVLGSRMGQPELWRDYVDVAALGTLSDMMQLTPENRALVLEGIERLRVSPRPGLKALAATSGYDLAHATSDELPFSLIPRLNAAGRMSSADLALDLLLTDDEAEAQELASRLEAINTERRETEAKLAEEALAEAERTYDGGRVVVVGGTGWHEGVKGIVASRLVNHYHVPAIVFTIVGDVARGSGRSVGSVDLFHAVGQCSDMLVRFGGHAGAVGVTCETARLDEFRERLGHVLAELPAEQFDVVEEVTAYVHLNELTVSSIQSLEALQPFGQGNKRPLFATVGVSMKNRARVGTDGSHLRFVAHDGTDQVPAIMFRVPNIEQIASWDGATDLVFEAVNETWAGRTKPKLMVKDILPRIADENAPAPISEVDRGRGAKLEEGMLPDASARALRERLARLNFSALTDELVRREIGDHELLPAQSAALDRLAHGRSCMLVMATGRGKSLVFHVHAAREAIAYGRASIFVYPLRALVADQAIHLEAMLAQVGVVARVLTGETPEADRERVYAALASGAVDVVLTTPEYLAIHCDRFAESGRIGFLVIDEAHHAGSSKSGQRSAYAELPQVLAALGHPVALAVTATADDEVAAETCRLLSIRSEDVLVDLSVRRNLLVDDCRETRDRDSALVSIVSTGEKCVVYVGTRGQAVSVTSELRHRIPELGHRIAFYHAGLTRSTRERVERAFRGDELSCIVSTSAFGEGVNLPGIRHVVIYSLPLGSVEFNQMSGRAGRDGKTAWVHLLYGSRDVRTGERIVSSSSPDRAHLVTLWRTLSAEWRTSRPIMLSDAEITFKGRQLDGPESINEHEVAAGLGIFCELGLCKISGWGESRQVTLVPVSGRLDLESSVRYVEGMRNREAFEEFSSWALTASRDDLEKRIDRPIAPGFGVVVDGEGGEASDESK